MKRERKKKAKQDENQNKDKSETKTLFKNSQISNKKEFKKVEYLLKLFGFEFSKIDKVIGIENKNWKRSFDICGQQIYGKLQNNPNLFKKEDWIEQSEPELRKSMIQYFGDYISKFREIGWNHGYDVISFFHSNLSFSLFSSNLFQNYSHL